MQTFEHGACTVIFLADIAGHDRYLEDPGINEMMDAMTLFEFVVNLPTCSSACPVVWFSNPRLPRPQAERPPVECSFPDYTGGPNIEKAVKYFTSRFRGLYRGGRGFHAVSCEPDDGHLIRRLLSLVDDGIHESALLASGIA